MKSAFHKSNLWLFILCLALSSLYLDWSLGWNTVSRVAMPLNLVLRGDLSITPYAEFTGDKALIDNTYYSDKAPLPGLLLAPVIYLLNLIINLSEFSLANQLKIGAALGGFFLGSLPFTLSVIKVKQMLKGILPLWLILLFFFGSFLFAFTGTAFSHCLAGLFSLLSFDSFSHKRGLQSGLWLGAAFCTEYSVAIFGFFWAVYWLLNKNYRQSLWLIAGTLPFLAFQAAYNYHLSGSILDFAYKFQENFAMNSENYGFTFLPSLRALWHITFSSYRGLFFYAPILILLLFNKVFIKSSFWKSADGYAAVACILYILLFSMSKSWYMGWTFGPRYLYTAALLLFCIMGQSYRTVAIKRWQKITIIGIGGLSIFHVWLAKVIYPYPPTDILFPAPDFLWPKLWDGSFYQYHMLHLLDFPSLYAAVLLLISLPGIIIWSWQIHLKAK